MAGVGLAPRRSVVTEDIRDFQNRPPHEGWGLCGRLGASRLQRGQAIQRAHDVPDDVGGKGRSLILSGHPFRAPFFTCILAASTSTVIAVQRDNQDENLASIRMRKGRRWREEGRA